MPPNSPDTGIIENVCAVKRCFRKIRYETIKDRKNRIIQF